MPLAAFRRRFPALGNGWHFSTFQRSASGCPSKVQNSIVRIGGRRMFLTKINQAMESVERCVFRPLSGVCALSLQSGGVDSLLSAQEYNP